MMCAGEKSKEGKQKFLASAAEQFQRLHGVEITRNTTLLIDDDHRNIQIALDKGVRALLFLPEEPEKYGFCIPTFISLLPSSVNTIFTLQCAKTLCAH